MVEGIIEQTKAKLLVIDDEIARLRAAIADMETHRGIVEEELATSKAVLAPIRHLPAEILTEIFLYASADSTMSWPRRNSSQPGCADDTVPWRLGEVCSYWRTLLLSLPGIWSTIHLDFSSRRLTPALTDALDLEDQLRDFIDVCVTRSANAMLSVTLKYNTDGMNSGEDISTRELACFALLLLVEVSERWHNVTLDMEDLFSFHELLAPARNRVPNLRTLHLASSGHPLTTPRPWNAIDAFTNAPQLNHLTLIHISHPTLHLRLPWHQLKYLKSNNSHYHEGEFTGLLKQARFLEEFRTEDERVLDMALAPTTLPLNNGPPIPHSAVYLPHLHTLSIINKGSYISRIFQLLTTPALEELSICSRTSFNAEPTIAMLRRSTCALQLRTLRLESSRDLEVVWEENYGIVCLLAETKGVDTLSLRVSKAADEIIPRLTVRRGMGGNPQRSPVLSMLGPAGYGGYASGFPNTSKMQGQSTVLLPKLRAFAIDDSFCESAGELKEMLESRIVGQEETAQLQDICLKLSRPAPPTYRELDALKAAAKEKGLAIAVYI